MAQTNTAAVIALAAAACIAAAPETDPVRRSLVVEAAQKAGPAVVNISTEQVVERRGSLRARVPLESRLVEQLVEALAPPASAVERPAHVEENRFYCWHAFSRAESQSYHASNLS